MKNKQLSDEIEEILLKLARAREEVESVEMRLTNAFEKFLTRLEQERTERCQVCDRTYPPDEIVKREGEQLCLTCDLDKYPIRDEDIPY